MTAKRNKTNNLHLTALWIDADKFRDNGVNSDVSQVLAYCDNETGDCVGYLEPYEDQYYCIVGNQEFTGNLVDAEKFLLDNWIIPNHGPVCIDTYLD